MIDQDHAVAHIQKPLHSEQIIRIACRLGLSQRLAELLQRYLKFGIVGGSGVAVDMIALFLLADPRTLHLNISLSKAMAAEIAIFSNFLGNEFWTFSDKTQSDLSWRGRLWRFWKFNVICAAGIALSVLLLNLQTTFFSMNVYFSNLIAIFIVSIWNFGMNLKFGWRKNDVCP